MAVLQQVNRADRPDATGAQAQSDSVAKPKPASDKVELSGRMMQSMSMPMNPDMMKSEAMPMNPEMMNDQAARAQRVADLKAQVQAGTYAVDSRAVAEKMISKLGAGKTVH